MTYRSVRKSWNMKKYIWGFFWRQIWSFCGHWVLGKEKGSAVSCALIRLVPQMRGICGLDLDAGVFFLILKIITLVFL